MGRVGENVGRFLEIKEEDMDLPLGIPEKIREEGRSERPREEDNPFRRWEDGVVVVVVVVVIVVLEEGDNEVVF